MYQYPDLTSLKMKFRKVKTFVQIHGEIKLHYTIYEKDQIIMLDTISPEDILIEGHNSELTAYKGVMISKDNAAKDMFKVDLLNMLQNK